MTDTDMLSDWNRRLRDQGERLVQAAEALPTPRTAAEVSRHARALASAQRMINLLCGVARPRAPRSGAEPSDLPQDTMSRIEALATALEADLPPLNRQQRRLAERLAKKRGG